MLYFDIYFLSLFQDYEENNEVCLDSWNPGRKGTSLSGDENSTYSSPNNSFMQTTLEDFNNLSGSQRLDKVDLDFCSVANSNRSSVASSGNSDAMSDNCSENNGRFSGSWHNSTDGCEEDYNSGPWINPKYATEGKHSCATWPIRK